MRKKQRFPLIIRIVILVILVFIIFTQNKEKKALKAKLNKLAVVAMESDSLKIIRGMDIDDSKILLTPDVINTFLHYKSPFKDGRSFTELNKKYIRNKRTDYYGTLRRTGQYRRKHDGIDWFAPENTRLYPLAPIGIVTQISDQEHGMYDVDAKDGKGKEVKVPIEYGKFVKILYPDGIQSMYVHMNEVFVEVGDLVYRDTCVGTSGYTGNIRNSGKPSHLHMELRIDNDKTVDPLNRVKFNEWDFNKFFEMIEITNEEDK